MFAPGGARLIVPSAVVLGSLVALLALHFLPWGVLPGLLTAVFAALLVFFLVFFRDPERTPGNGIVSAADGRVRAVDRVGNHWRVSVFMNVTNVHVNRFPVEGKVETIEPGGSGFALAFRPDAERNAQLRYALATALGPVEVVQIAGAVARRIVPFVAPGALGRKGDRLGMIVLGSRVDVLLPADRVTPTVRVGDRVRAAVTTIAREGA